MQDHTTRSPSNQQHNRIACHCLHCGKEFEVIPSRVAHGRGKYCSRECQYGKTRTDYFWDHVDKAGPIHPALGTACWLWTGSTAGGKGYPYGHFWDGEKLVQAHRYSWELHHGPIPSGEGFHGTCVLHYCDNPACVRPEHLHLGTQSDNAQEMWERDRKDVNGSKNPAAKLTQQDADEIKKLYGYRGLEGLTLQALADRYDVGTSTIHRIVTGKTWGKEVPHE